MQADAALRITKFKGIERRAKQRMLCFNACIVKQEVDQKSDPLLDQPKVDSNNVESLIFPRPDHALECSGSLFAC